MPVKIIAIANHKGGIGKTSVTANLGIGLATEGKRVLVVDCDSQRHLTLSLGYSPPDTNLATTLMKIVNDSPIAPMEGILHHNEGVDLMPSHKELVNTEMTITNVMSRETVLKQYLATVKKSYDYILLDCPPALHMMTLNALSAADGIIIPTQTELLSVKAIAELLDTIKQVKRNINPQLKIDGILPTMVDERTNFNKEVLALLHDTYGNHVKVFPMAIPRSVRAAEAMANGQSIFAYAPKSKVAQAYTCLTKEILEATKQRNKNHTQHR